MKALRVVCAGDSGAVEARGRKLVEWASGEGNEGHDRLAAFLRSDEVRGGRVAVALPAEEGLVETVKLPPVGSELLAEAIQFEVGKRLPVALDRLAWDVHLLDDPAQRKEAVEPIEGILVAARREVVDALLQPYVDAALSVELCQLSSAALVNALAWERSGSGGATVLVDIGATRTRIVLTDGRRLWQRIVPFGGDRFTGDLAERFKLGWPKAEALKRNPLKAPDPLAVAKALRRSYEELVAEIDRSIVHYRGLAPGLRDPRVRLLGNGSRTMGLEAFLKQQLGLELERLEATWGGPAGPLEGDSRFAVPLGLGVQALGLGAIRANLLPPESQSRPGWLRGGVFSRLFRPGSG